MVNVLRSYRMFSECEMTIVYSKHRRSARTIFYLLYAFLLKEMRDDLFRSPPPPIIYPCVLLLGSIVNDWTWCSWLMAKSKLRGIWYCWECTHECNPTWV